MCRTIKRHPFCRVSDKTAKPARDTRATQGAAPSKLPLAGTIPPRQPCLGALLALRPSDGDEALSIIWSCRILRQALLLSSELFITEAHPGSIRQLLDLRDTFQQTAAMAEADPLLPEKLDPVPGVYLQGRRGQIATTHCILTAFQQHSTSQKMASPNPSGTEGTRRRIRRTPWPASAGRSRSARMRSRQTSVCQRTGWWFSPM